MNTSAQGTTFSSFTAEQKAEYRKQFIETHRNTLNKILTDRQIEVFTTGCVDEDKDDYMKGAIVPLISKVLGTIRKCFWPSKANVKRVATQFRFSRHKLCVSADLELLMRVLTSLNIQPYPELFRQSASVKEVSALYEHLKRIKPMQYSPLSKSSTEQEEIQEQEAMQTLIYDLQEFEIITISAVFKIVLKNDCPILPTKHIELYRKIQALSDPKDKIVFSKFIIAFLIDRSKTEILEIVCNFLYTLVTKPNSPLKFRNLSVVFTPLFFIDESFTVIDANFKEPLEDLRDYLEFLLDNSPKIFLI
ncbi:hypothetical protein NEOKW01_1172 [Nematocida sp. AWRm80]|nr:hypothetical protein NEOKW01_1172 [Nematocida sp. AWRm80]